MAEPKIRASVEGRELHVDVGNLPLPEMVSVSAERGNRWAQYSRKRSDGTWTFRAFEEQPEPVQAKAGGINVCVVGKSHLAFCTAVAAAARGHTVYPEEEIEKAELVLFAEDVKTDSNGHRQSSFITSWAERYHSACCLVICSQVTPGFTRAIQRDWIYAQPEQLRIVTATDNACKPPRIVVGCAQPTKFEELPAAYRTYLQSFNCPVILTDYETAEFSKIAINMWLAAQVDTTNRLAAAAAKVGADWETVAKAMRLDPRIGPEAYLKPGRWQDSLHLLRDSVTLEEIERARK